MQRRCVADCREPEKPRFALLTQPLKRRHYIGAAAEAQRRELHSCSPEYSHFHRRSSACDGNETRGHRIEDGERAVSLGPIRALVEGEVAPK
jgi:hypothetical protein